ncbi:unnamed protein product [Amoebophrya sp. A120]|nr:unnamed protein product [Amoebophrya sp. A120]|eukprot:GSA120T00008244001.1
MFPSLEQDTIVAEVSVAFKYCFVCWSLVFVAYTYTILFSLMLPCSFKLNRSARSSLRVVRLVSFLLTEPARSVRTLPFRSESEFDETTIFEMLSAFVSIDFSVIAGKQLPAAA